MKLMQKLAIGVLSLLAAMIVAAATASAQQQRPNIIVIMGDDIGWFNIGAYHQGMMASRTPNLDRLAAEGMRFTDYYAEASCTAGRANFITGELPIRTGLTTVGQAGSPLGMPDEAPTIATVLKSMGYATGQFGKNHLGDLNQFLPTLHGFDEFYGYLYHLDAMEDPCHPNYPPALKATVGPRNMLHSYRQTKDRGRRRALSQTHGDRGRRNPEQCFRIHRQGKAGEQVVLCLAQPHPHARGHAPLGEIREDAHA
jgi:arylsulfatase